MGRKKKKKEGPSGPKGAPEWVVTFTDMISLLVTFFVLLMTFSSMNVEDVERIESILQAKTGIMKNDGMAVQETPDQDIISATDLQRGSSQPHSRPAEKLSESLAEMGQKKTEDHQEIDFSAAKDGLVIEFGEEECFAPGSVDVPPELARSLGEIGRVLENYPNLVVVEGFTDDDFRPTGEYTSAEALSFARAAAAAEILRAGSTLPAELLQMAGLGPESPRADNTTAEGRQRNRRVQIRVVALSKMRASYLEAQATEGALSR